MIDRTPKSLLILLVAASLFGCAQSPMEEMSAEAAVEIDWFEGTPDEAFAHALAVGKPLFLYWGAEWCPPCHYLKDKIFSQADFVERSQRFVAVYLDGDEESAQILGEQLDVQGYPTVMVFSSSGDELLRMPSDVPVGRYAAVMERALNLDRPVREILASVLEGGPAQASEQDLDVLAYYSWGQDSQIDLEEDARLETFERLWEETPARLAGVRARFLGLYLGEASRLARQAEEGDPPILDEDRRDELTTATLAMLSSEELSRENLFDVTYTAASTIDLLQPEAGARRAEVVAGWHAAAERLEADESLSTDDRLTLALTRIELARLDVAEESELPEGLIAHVRDRVAWAVGEASGGSELQTLLNTAAFLLDEVGLADEAQRLLTDKLDEAEAPYYFMSWLAGLKNDAGETDEALTLYRQAWESATGRYTRFRWGSTYLRRLMELAPDRVAAIESDSLAILDELLAHDDAFALGNWLRLGQLEKAYTEWNAEGAHAEAVGGIRARVHDACERYPAAGEDSQQERCASFLAVAT